MIFHFMVGSFGYDYIYIPYKMYITTMVMRILQRFVTDIIYNRIPNYCFLLLLLHIMNTVIRIILQPTQRYILSTSQRLHYTRRHYTRLAFLSCRRCQSANNCPNWRRRFSWPPVDCWETNCVEKDEGKVWQVWAGRRWALRWRHPLAEVAGVVGEQRQRESCVSCVSWRRKETTNDRPSHRTDRPSVRKCRRSWTRCRCLRRQLSPVSRW